MKKVKILIMIFTFWILLIILSSSWLVFLFLNNLHLATTNFQYGLILVIALFSFFLSMYFIMQILYDVRVELKKEREKQRNIRDMYKYDQLLEPPSIYN